MMRAVSFDDRSQLEQIHRAAFGEAQGWSATFIGGQMALPGTFGIVDPSGGFVLVRCIIEEAEILTLAVAPEKRRCGIGASLMTLALAQAADLGGRTMFLEVSETNLPAQALYRALGFAQVGMRPGYYDDGATALVMSRALDPRSS